MVELERTIVLDAHTTHRADVIGNKGASVARMLGLGLPVPPAFVLPIDECRRWRAAGGVLEEDVWDSVLDGLGILETETGRRLGDASAPLLVSVRSGAAVSMPGMMDTVLNLGMTDDVEAGLARLADDDEFARATHARFVHGFGQIVLGGDLDEPAPGTTADEMRETVEHETGAQVPAAPLEQLRAAICAVFGSWNSRRAAAYRRHWGIDDDGGTAVIIQAMVFGNLGTNSGTGVLFTRDPLTGAPGAYGEWLPGAQGEDVVNGTHDCLPLSALAALSPTAHAQLLTAAGLLERELGDVQDIEFTLERGRLYLLQTRGAKRSAAAALRTAAELAQEGVISRAEALSRVTVEQVVAVLAPRLSPQATAGAAVLARGVAACPGVAAGLVVADAEAAVTASSDVVLARPTTSPEDVSGMIAAAAIVTERGGATSHAAVVSRALGRPSVVGVGDGKTDDWLGQPVTVDGSHGVVYAGVLPTEATAISAITGFMELNAWATELSPVAVVENASGVLDLDAQGIEPDASDVNELAAVMRGAPAVSGLVLATEAGARAVLAAGVPAVVPQPGQQPLTLLLQLVQAARTDGRT
jgi:pyruvate, orthophosphate dikinase